MEKLQDIKYEELKIDLLPYGCYSFNWEKIWSMTNEQRWFNCQVFCGKEERKIVTI